MNVFLKGNPVKLSGILPEAGQIAPDFKVVKQDLGEMNFYSIQTPVKVIISVPSIDTGVCALESKTFNKKLDSMQGKVTGLIVSMDLPFAMKRFCETEGVASVLTTSDYRHSDFGKKFGAQLADGPLQGLLARAVWVVDASNKIRYSEIVNEITSEPDYEKVMEQVKLCL